MFLWLIKQATPSPECNGQSQKMWPHPILSHFIHTASIPSKFHIDHTTK